MENKPTLVVALGGNALLKRGEPLEADIQRKNIELAAKTIAQLTQQWRVILVHGNGPQVGLWRCKTVRMPASPPIRSTFSARKVRE
jgi:carbamate kinase